MASSAHCFALRGANVMVGVIASLPRMSPDIGSIRT
jgi:hypothetical protein